MQKKLAILSSKNEKNLKGPSVRRVSPPSYTQQPSALVHAPFVSKETLGIGVMILKTH